MCEICDARAEKIREASKLMMDEGRIIEAMWFLFRLNEPPGTTEEEVDMVRDVYFAGATDLFDCLSDALDLGGRKEFAKVAKQVEFELETQVLRNQTAMGTA
jgi:hypothetical protein